MPGLRFSGRVPYVACFLDVATVVSSQHHVALSEQPGRDAPPLLVHSRGIWASSLLQTRLVLKAFFAVQIFFGTNSSKGSS